jgi:osmotically-inducible protein OsmY
MQPYGNYPIHIIVKRGRTTLVGVVDNASDKQLAEVRAREVGGVFKVTNELVVITP